MCWARLRSFYRGVVRRSEMERDLSDELKFHLERRAEDLAARSGMTQPRRCEPRASSSDRRSATRKKLGRAADSGSSTSFTPTSGSRREACARTKALPPRPSPRSHSTWRQHRGVQRIRRRHPRSTGAASRAARGLRLPAHARLDGRVLRRLLRLPRDVLGRAPRVGKSRVIWNRAGERPSEERPLVARGESRGRDKERGSHSEQ